VTSFFVRREKQEIAENADLNAEHARQVDADRRNAAADGVTFQACP
jgi:hypothetical protein